MAACTIVMYHYVRDLSRRRFPNVNALTIDEFRYQLAYLDSEYAFIGMEDLKSAFLDDEPLPENAALLTFDDGFAEHYETVFPLLMQRDIQGAFFPPVEAIRFDAMLDVHKIHAVLARRESDRELLETVFDLLEDYRSRFDLRPSEDYYDELTAASRWDPEEIVFVKRLLQHALPPSAREAILDDLFERYVSVDEATLSREWYMTPDQLRVMVESGMYVGSHTVTHERLDTLSRERTVAEVEQSLGFLEDLGSETEWWVMCYPYGQYSETTLEVLREYDCALGLTTEPRRSDPAGDDPIAIPRLDTNDLPQSDADR